MSATLLAAFLLAAAPGDAPTACDQRFGSAEETERLHREGLTSLRDGASCNALASFLLDKCWNGQRREEAVTTLEDCAALQPENADIHVRIARLCLEGASQARKTDDRDKAAALARGLDAVNLALSIQPDHAEGLTYKALLLREMAKLPSEAGRRKKLLAEAEELKRRSQAARKRTQTESP